MFSPEPPAWLSDGLHCAAGTCAPATQPAFLEQSLSSHPLNRFSTLKLPLAYLLLSPLKNTTVLWMLLMSLL